MSDQKQTTLGSIVWFGFTTIAAIAVALLSLSFIADYADRIEQYDGAKKLVFVSILVGVGIVILGSLAVLGANITSLFRLLAKNDVDRDESDNIC